MFTLQGYRYVSEDRLIALPKFWLGPIYSRELQELQDLVLQSCIYIFTCLLTLKGSSRKVQGFAFQLYMFNRLGGLSKYSAVNITLKKTSSCQTIPTLSLTSNLGLSPRFWRGPHKLFSLGVSSSVESMKESSFTFICSLSTQFCIGIFTGNHPISQTDFETVRFGLFLC